MEFIFMIFMAGGCGQMASEEPDLSINVYLKDEWINEKTNTLIVKAPKGSKMLLTSDTVEAPDLGVVVDVKEQTPLTAKAEGRSQVTVKIYRADGFVTFNRTMGWSFSTVPVVGAVIGTASDFVSDFFADILIGGNRDENTQEIWLEGDLAADFEPQGIWRQIPVTSRLTIKLSPGDGEKKIKAKLRNLYKTESDQTSLSVLQSSLVPENCNVAVPSLMIGSAEIRAHISGDTPHQLQMRAMGDVIKFHNDFINVPNNKSEMIFKTTPDNGEKSITFQIRDNYGNYCYKNVLKFNLNVGYEKYTFKIKGDPLVTASPSITVLPNADIFDHEKLEVYLYGDLAAGETVRTWMPYTKDMEIPVSLVSGDSSKWVKVQFRDPTGAFFVAPAINVYLNPFIHYRFGQVILSNIIGVVRAEVTGCSSQSISVEDFIEAVPCAADSDAVLTVTYYALDGKEVAHASTVVP
jgi:hypothetical protein